MRQVLLAFLLSLTQGTVAAQESVSQGTGVVLRGLDKVDGDIVDMSLSTGESAEIGRLTVRLRECRYPQGTATDAYAFLTISDTPGDNVVFDGWMIASSPALNALEHPRYDVWVLRCNSE